MEQTKIKTELFIKKSDGGIMLCLNTVRHGKNFELT